MQAAISKKVSDARAEWFCLKLSFLLMTLPLMYIMAYSSSSCPFPTGICRLYSFDLLFSDYGRLVLIASFFVLGVLYLLERKMLLVTFLLSLLSCIIISHHESNGIYFRATILTTVWIAQFLAYLRYHFDSDFDLSFFRIQYVVQIIGASYTLAAIAKLRASGLAWVDAGDFFPLQIVKNYAFRFFDTGDSSIWQEGQNIAYFLLKHQWIVRLFLATSLALELFCLLAAIGQKTRLFFGIGLVMMHIGIASIMGIGMSVISKPMIIFFLNPVYRVRQLIVYSKIKFQSGR